MHINTVCTAVTYDYGRRLQFLRRKFSWDDLSYALREITILELVEARQRMYKTYNFPV